MELTIYYGLSGALKGTTINSRLRQNATTQVMYSAIKDWKYYHQTLFPELLEKNDLIFTNLHLVRLSEFLGKSNNLGDLIVERGVTDSLFYYLGNDEYGTSQYAVDSPSLVRKVVAAEDQIINRKTRNVRKILLVQEDPEFVTNKVLKDQFRQQTFKNDVDYYFEQQSKYIEFTKTYNDISEIIRIPDARKYIEEKLGVEYIY